jgi:hypothetical protein
VPQRLGLDFQLAKPFLQIGLRIVRKTRRLACPRRVLHAGVVNEEFDRRRSTIYSSDDLAPAHFDYHISRSACHGRIR